MKELLQLKNRKGIKTVDGRDLHRFLGVGRDFSTWINQRVDKYKFQPEIDYMIVKTIPQNGGIALQYYITLDMAKELAMVENNEKGREARRYFIEVEKKARNIIPDFTNPAEAARSWAIEYENRVKLEAQNEELKPKALFYDQVTGSKDTIEMKEAAKVLNMGIGRNKLFQFLRDQKILDKKNEPYQKYVDRGYFRVVETRWEKHGDVKINLKTLVYQKGLDYIRKRYMEDK